MPLEAPASLLFTGTAIRQQGKKTYGVYCMQCQDRDGKTWTCEKRYSEFVSLKKALIKDKCVKVKQFENFIVMILMFIVALIDAFLGRGGLIWSDSR